MIDVMLGAEARLASLSKRGTLAKHSLGYKKSESLFAREGGNTPNNVFPIFWWEQLASGADRHSLLQCI
jgi:hypothetical protein